MPIPEEMLKAVTTSEWSSIAKFLGDKQPAPFALWFEDYFDDLCDAKLTIGEPVSLLDEERLSVCRLKTFYLVMCHSSGNFYSTSNSSQRIHGGIWYHSLLQSLVNETSRTVG
jgi:hypothetical protein